MVQQIVAIYSFLSLCIFHRVYFTSEEVIDEMFHLRQAKHYCDGNFTVWDPKITTLPGLYIVSAALLAPIQMCNTYGLRMVSLAASVINLYLIYQIRRKNQKSSNKKCLAESLAIATLPPMYFFVHLYYTDIVSITFILAMLYYSQLRKHFIAAVCAAGSVLMRQTNIVWVGLVMLLVFCDKILQEHRVIISKHIPYADITTLFRMLINYPLTFVKTCCKAFCTTFWYFSVIVLFIAFVYVNGSIVVGDKTAHQAKLHIPQIFYFSIFMGIFGGPILFQHLKGTLNLLARHWCVSTLAVTIALLAVHYNTLVHPYMLADNRHYTFYLWNRLYGRYTLFKYAMAPIYVVCLTCVWRSMKANRYQLVYAVCVVVSIGLQQLLEVRYFVLPFLMWRLVVKAPPILFIMLELLGYLVINYMTFYMFMTKEIWWDDNVMVQRLMW